MATRRLPFSPGRRRRWSRVSAARIKDLRMHPNRPREAAIADATRTPAARGPPGASARVSRRPRAAPPPRERGAGAAGPVAAARARAAVATQCGPGAPPPPPPPPLPQARGRHKARRRAPTLGSGAGFPQRLGHRLPDVAAQQAEQERRRPAHLRAAGPRAARAGRPPARSGASGAAGRRASLHIAWLRARRARRPIGRAPARRGAGPRSPRPLPPPRAPVGFPEEPPPRLRRLFNPFAPRPRRRPGPGPWCHLAAARPRAPPVRPPPRVRPARPPVPREQ